MKKHLGKILVLECVTAAIGLALQIQFTAWTAKDNAFAWGAEQAANTSSIILGVVKILIYAAFCTALIIVTLKAYRKRNEKQE